MKKRYWQKLDPDCRLHSLRSVLHPLAPVAILVEPRWTKRNRKKHFKFSACSMQFQIYRSASREINSKRSFETWRIFSHRQCQDLSCSFCPLTQRLCHWWSSCLYSAKRTPMAYWPWKSVPKSFVGALKSTRHLDGLEVSAFWCFLSEYNVGIFFWFSDSHNALGWFQFSYLRQMTFDCFLCLSSVPYPRTLVLFCAAGILLYPVLTLSWIAFCTWKYPKLPGNLFLESEGCFNCLNLNVLHAFTSFACYVWDETPSDPRALWRVDFWYAEVAQIAWWFANRQCLWRPKSDLSHLSGKLSELDLFSEFMNSWLQDEHPSHCLRGMWQHVFGWRMAEDRLGSTREYQRALIETDRTQILWPISRQHKNRHRYKK